MKLRQAHTTDCPVLSSVVWPLLAGKANCSDFPVRGLEGMFLDEASKILEEL